MLSGVEALAMKLHGNKTLTRLDVSYNGVGDPGAGALAAMLRHNHTLQILCLGYNQV